MAFAVSDDHAAQEQVLKALPDWDHRPETIRSHLMVSNIDADDPRVVFVGLRAYKKAVGHILRDLFQPEHEGYLTDSDILHRLVVEKLEREAETIRAEGWKWVIIMPKIDREKLRGLGHVYPEREPVTEAQQAEIDELATRYEVLFEEHGEEPPEDIAAELDDISAKIDTLSEGQTRWLPEDVAIAGAVIGIGYDGELAVERGYVKPEDEPAETGKDGDGGDPAPRPKDGPDRLMEDLTAHRTAALRAVLAGNTEVALVAVIHALAWPLFYSYSDGPSCLTVRFDTPELRGSADGIDDSPACRVLADQRQSWMRRLPGAPKQLWDWLLQQESGTRLALLAYCAACSVDAVKKRQQRATVRFDHADELATALGLDMTQWWQPTAASYFRHVSKARILDDVRKEAADTSPTSRKTGSSPRPRRDLRTAVGFPRRCAYPRRRSRSWQSQPNRPPALPGRSPAAPAAGFFVRPIRCWKPAGSGNGPRWGRAPLGCFPPAPAEPDAGANNRGWR